MVTTFIILAIIVVVIGYVITIYNNLVALKNNVEKSWSNIDVLLKQRHDELPKLVATAKEYMQYEQETLEKVTNARAEVGRAREAGDVAAVGMAEQHLRMGLGQLFAVAENYPDLKANNSFMHLQSRISDLENTISDRREEYNENVTNYNTRIEQMPDMIIANMCHYQRKSLLEFSEAEKQDVDVKALFNS